MFERSIPVRQRANASLFASLHERLAGTTGTKELAEIERRFNEARAAQYPAPPEDLADAWRRYQAGEEVEPYELRALDEWRADVHEAHWEES